VGQANDDRPGQEGQLRRQRLQAANHQRSPSGHGW
jgi:hypothetical protein